MLYRRRRGEIVVYLIINAYRNAFNNTIRVQSFTALRNVVQNAKSYFFEFIFQEEAAKIYYQLL